MATLGMGITGTNPVITLNYVESTYHLKWYIHIWQKRMLWSWCFKSRLHRYYIATNYCISKQSKQKASWSVCLGLFLSFSQWYWKRYHISFSVLVLYWGSIFWYYNLDHNKFHFCLVLHHFIFLRYAIATFDLTGETSRGFAEQKSVNRLLRNINSDYYLEGHQLWNMD